MAQRQTSTTPRTGLAGTVGQTDITNPENPALRMPDPGDPVRNEWLKGLVMRRLRGGRKGTILSGLLRRMVGTQRTARTGEDTASTL